MSFWDVVWFIVISFAFVAYLMVMFMIIGDLFRDHEASGWAKAAWIVFLIFVPLLTSLTYLIVKGQGMTERSQRSQREVKAQQDAYIREVAGKPSATEQIAQAQAMLEQGVISQAEFDSLKAKALV